MRILSGSNRCDPVLPFEGRDWIAFYDSHLDMSARALEAARGLVAIRRRGATPSLLPSDGHQRVGLGRGGANRRHELLAPYMGRSIAYARMDRERISFSWRHDGESWSITLLLNGSAVVPSILRRVPEMDRRMDFAVRVLESLQDEASCNEARRIGTIRSETMDTVLAQALHRDGIRGRVASMHVDDRVLGWNGSFTPYCEAGCIRPSGNALRRLDDLPTPLSVQHSRGRPVLGSNWVNTISIGTRPDIGMEAGDPVTVMRMLSSIPEDETWWRRAA